LKALPRARKTKSRTPLCRTQHRKEDIVQTLKTTILTASVAVILLASTAIANAASVSYSSVIVYGDSLSDNGNLFAATSQIPAIGGYPPAPYYMGRFSNGPVAVEQLAAKLGVPLIDFAFGGATTGVGNQLDGGTQTSLGAFNVPGMLTELAAFPPPAALTSTALFVVWGGANDYELNEPVNVAIGDIDAIVNALRAAGATHILVPGLPDLGLTPEFLGNPTATAFSETFNQGLQATLPPGVTYFDTFGLLNSIEANPGAYGITNTTGSCLTATSLCTDPSQFIFFDDIHPTTTLDAIVAQQFDAAVTPEPSTILMLGTGIAGLAELLRRRRAA
jgi:phospholipase/lecithinase/hemolysin